MAGPEAVRAVCLEGTVAGVRSVAAPRAARRHGRCGGGPAGPRPAAVPCNDWRRIRLPEATTFVPTLPVSVIVPCFEAPDALALTLAGLEGQD